MGVSAGVAIAAASLAYTVYSTEQAKKNRPKLPGAPAAALTATQPNEVPLNLQAIRRQRAAAGAESTQLTGPQGLAGGVSQPVRKTLLGA